MNNLCPNKKDWKTSINSLRSLDENFSDSEKDETDTLFGKSSTEKSSVTIFRNDQLGISINVEEPQEFPVEKKKNKESMFNRIVGHGSLSSAQKKQFQNEETVPKSCIANNRNQTYKDFSLYPLDPISKSSKSKKLRSQVYMFLEHPSGWLCFAYHLLV